MKLKINSVNDKFKSRPVAAIDALMLSYCMPRPAGRLVVRKFLVQVLRLWVSESYNIVDLMRRGH